MDDAVRLHALKFTFPDVGKGTIVNIAVGKKPVVDVGSAAKPAATTSMVATFGAETVTALPHAPAPIAVAGMVAVPLAIVDVRPPAAEACAASTAATPLPNAGESGLKLVPSDCHAAHVGAVAEPPRSTKVEPPYIVPETGVKVTAPEFLLHTWTKKPAANEPDGAGCEAATADAEL